MEQQCRPVLTYAECYLSYIVDTRLSFAGEGNQQPMVTKTRETGFATEVVRTARWGRALAHPARLTILRMLATRRTCLCGEIVDDLPLAQSTVSQHLRVLREEGLVRGEVDGPRSCYCIDADRVREMMADLNRLGASLGRDAACGC